MRCMTRTRMTVVPCAAKLNMFSTRSTAKASSAHMSMLTRNHTSGERLIMGFAKSCIHCESMTVQLPVSRSSTQKARMPDTMKVLQDRGTEQRDRAEGQVEGATWAGGRAVGEGR